MFLIRCIVLSTFIVLSVNTASAQSPQPLGFHKGGDSLIYFTANGAWFMPSGKRYYGHLYPFKVESKNKGMANTLIKRANTSKDKVFTVMGGTYDKLLALGGKNYSEAWVLEADPKTPGKFKPLYELEGVTKVIKESKKDKMNIIFAGSTVNRFYYIFNGSLFSVADDGSDGNQPREEIKAPGGLTLLNLGICPTGRYALLQLGPTSHKIYGFEHGTYDSYVTRVFDLQTRKPLLDIKPDDERLCFFSNDSRYMIYKGADSTYFYDLHERKVISKHFRGLLHTKDGSLYQQYYLDDKYLYLIQSPYAQINYYIWDLREKKKIINGNQLL